MGRYYLDVPKTTFDMLQPYQLDENGEIILNKDGSYRKNRKYNPELASKLSKFSRIQSLDFDSIQPRRLDDSSVIVEVDFNGSQYDPESFTDEERKLFTDADGNLSMAKIEEYKLDQYVANGALLGYGHWPHKGDGRRKCIHCYLKEHHDEFFEPEPEL